MVARVERESCTIAIRRKKKLCFNDGRFVTRRLGLHKPNATGAFLEFHAM